MRIVAVERRRPWTEPGALCWVGTQSGDWVKGRIIAYGRDNEFLVQLDHGARVVKYEYEIRPRHPSVNDKPAKLEGPPVERRRGGI